MEPVLMKLNTETRWFEVCADRPVEKPQPPTAEDIARLLAERGPMPTGEIVEHYKDCAGRNGILKRISNAEQMSLIEKPGRQSPWQACDGKLVYSSSPIGGKRVNEFFGGECASRG